MGSANVIKQEFEIWLEHLQASLAKVNEILGAQQPDLDKLLESFEDMTTDSSSLEAFRPVSNKVQPYDFATAIPFLASAKRLTPKVTRILQREGKLIVNDQVLQKDADITSKNVPISKKIPELQIQPSDGDITTYNSFCTAFRLKFQDLPLPDSMKLGDLKSHVTGHAFTMIKNLELVDANYNRAFKILDNEYLKPDEVVSALYHKIDTLPRANKSNTSLQNTYYALEGLLSALESHGQDIEAIPPIRDRILTKYPLFIVEDLCKEDVPTIKVFQRRMAARISVRKNIEAAALAANIHEPKYENKSFQKPPHAATAALVASSEAPLSEKKERTKNDKQPPSKGNEKQPTNKGPTPTCAFCAEKHYSADCTAVTQLNDRLAKIKDRCHRCLNTAHTTDLCPKQFTCRYCKKQNDYHMSICPDQFLSSNKVTASAAAMHTRVVNFVQRCRGAHSTLVVPIINPQTRRPYRARVFLDMGSNDTYVTENAAKRFGLILSKFHTVPVTVFGDNEINMRTASTSFLIKTSDSEVLVHADTTPRAPQNVHLFDYDEFKLHYPEYSSKAFVKSGEDEPIDIILGNDYIFDFILPESKITVTEGLFLVNTTFGWLLTGRQQSRNRVNHSVFSILSPQDAINQLSSLESIGITDVPLSKVQEEQNALDQFYENLKFVENRYQIRWPWREYPPPLQNNFGLAIGRLRSQLRSLSDTLFQAYDKIIRQQLESGIVEEIPKNFHDAPNTYYVPHHAVFTPEKSTPLRIVYDGKTRPAKHLSSINDAIYKGRNILTDLVGVILRFRLQSIAIIADLEKCFHQLSVHPLDRDYVRFLWVHDPKKPPTGDNLRIIRFTRVAFGIVASPFLSNAVLHYHLQQNETVHFSIKDIYVDNLIKGASDLSSAKEFYNSAVEIFNKCSMNIRNWATSSAEFRQFIPNHHIDLSPQISVLGILWDQYNDVIRVKRITREKTLTLHSILSTSATFYDPCGYFSPISIRAKILMQDIRKKDFGWQDTLPIEFLDRWETIQNEFDLASTHQMARFQFDVNTPSPSRKYQLHCFADASKRAYACVIYIRVGEPTETKTFLLFSKARISPTQPVLTIPHLELFAALLGTRALKFVTSELPLQFDRIILWSDSKCVLHWIGSTKILPAFTKRRIDEIRNFQNLEFRFIPGELNPADMPSRGVDFDQLMENWWCGPHFLRNTEDTWPQLSVRDFRTLEIQPEQENEPINTVLNVFQNVKQEPFELSPHCRASYRNLLRVSARVIEFLRSFNVLRRKQIFSAHESSFLIAQRIWIKSDQRNHYADIICTLKTKKEPHKKNPLIRKFNLLLDEHDIIRCAGRFLHATLSDTEKQPILLACTKVSFLSKLIVSHYHELNFHVGTSHTLAALRKRYWLPRGRAAVFNVLKSCARCKRFTTQAYAQPQISDLPLFRLQQDTMPFMNIGIDTFGHIWVGRTKRWVLIVVDLVIRSIELEILQNMRAETISLAFRNVSARRTQPHYIVSDNAPQFDVLKKHMQSSYTHEFDWQRIPEKASWMAGVYERLIAPVKQALLRTFHGQPLTDQTLRIALAEIAATLNERPLTYVSADIDDIPLTPNDFMHSKFQLDSYHLLHEASTPVAAHVVKIWKQSNEVLNKFWSVWRTHYLQFLRERGAKDQFAKRNSTRQPQEGDVIIAKQHQKRAAWKLGMSAAQRTSSPNVILHVNHKKVMLLSSLNLSLIHISEPTRPY